MAALALMAAAAPPAMASHFRFGHITATPAGGNTMNFTVNIGWRRSAFGGTGGDGFVVTGDLTSIGSDFCAGDGFCTSLTGVVTSHDVTNDWFIATATIQHTYASAGTYTAFTFSCCRISTCSTPNAHPNNPDGDFNIAATVNVGGNNSTPVSSLPAIVNCPVGAPCSFTVPASDNEGGVTYRMSTPGEAAFTLQPGDGNGCTGGSASINPNSGLFTWDSAGCQTAAGLCGQPSFNTLYSTQVTIEDGSGASSVVDFLINLVPNTCTGPNTAPSFSSPACGGTLTAAPDEPITFNVSASDVDASSTVTLQQGGAPAGSSHSPTLPVAANPANSSFSWTPTQAQVGQHVITYTATDNCGAQVLCSVTIDVSNEICNNNEDDDGDEAVDCNDLDCEFDPSCVVVSTTSTLPPTTSTTLPQGACCTPSGCSQADANLCQIEFGGTYQGDGTSCQTPGICSTCGNGCVEQGEECDDGGSLDGDGCDSDCAVEQCYSCSAGTTTTFFGTGGACSASVCTPDDGQSCDDGDICTLGDSCSGGVCGGDAVLIPAACEWVMVGGDPARKVQSRIRGNTTVVGDICGDSVRIGDSSSTTGDIVATDTTGDAVFFAAAAVVNGDVVTDGAGVIGKPRDTILPGLAVDNVPGGNTATQSGNAAYGYDTTGADPRPDDCDDAQEDIEDAAAAIGALSPTADMGNVAVKGGATLNINATNVGGLNVIDFENLVTGNDADIVLNAGGNANTVFILRIERKLDVRLRSGILLTGNANAGRVIILVGSKCKIGEDVTGAGTLVCPDGKLKLEERVSWAGAVLGGRKRVQLRDGGVLTHFPLQVGQ